ncbi:hypothetical protein [Borreliella garinii]|nr:hypothetical protein [Borreliella garinii]
MLLAVWFQMCFIKLGHGFVDVFNAIGGLVSNVFYKAGPWIRRRI